MIYECPQCQKPQVAGQTVCPFCLAEFDGPVPGDAIMPPEAEATPVAATAAEAVTAADTAAEIDPGPMPLDPPSRDSPAETIKSAPAMAAPLVESLPPASGGPEPYLTPPTYAPPTYAPPTYAPPLYTPPSAEMTGAPYKPVPPTLSKLSRALLIAFPVVLVLVLLGVYLASSLNSDSSEVGPEPPVAARTEAAPPPPAPVGSPLLLQGGSNTNDGSDYRVKLLAGRWTSKSDNFYVFNADGTGSRGSTTNPNGEQSFLWGLVQNRLMLYGAKNETLRFNAGPDNDTVFLGPQTGRYVQYSRAKGQ